MVDVSGGSVSPPGEAVVGLPLLEEYAGFYGGIHLADIALARHHLDEEVANDLMGEEVEEGGLEDEAVALTLGAGQQEMVEHLDEKFSAARALPWFDHASYQPVGGGRKDEARAAERWRSDLAATSG